MANLFSLVAPVLMMTYIIHALQHYNGQFVSLVAPVLMMTYIINALQHYNGQFVQPSSSSINDDIHH